MEHDPGRRAVIIGVGLGVIAADSMVSGGMSLAYVGNKKLQRQHDLLVDARQDFWSDVRDIKFESLDDSVTMAHAMKVSSATQRLYQTVFGYNNDVRIEVYPYEEALGYDNRVQQFPHAVRSFDGYLVERDREEMPREPVYFTGGMPGLTSPQVDKDLVGTLTLAHEIIRRQFKPIKTLQNQIMAGFIKYDDAKSPLYGLPLDGAVAMTITNYLLGTEALSTFQVLSRTRTVNSFLDLITDSDAINSVPPLSLLFSKIGLSIGEVEGLRYQSQLGSFLTVFKQRLIRQKAPLNSLWEAELLVDSHQYGQPQKTLEDMAYMATERSLQTVLRDSIQYAFSRRQS